MKSMANYQRIHLHPAAIDDCELVFGWRNLPEIVQLSSSGRQVSLGEHVEWYARILADTGKSLFIVEANGSPIGVIRFDVNASNEAEISVYLVPEEIGKGFGALAIMTGCELLFATKGIKRFIAKVKSGNIRSAMAFAKCGFNAMCDSAGMQDHITLVKLMECASNDQVQ